MSTYPSSSTYYEEGSAIPKAACKLPFMIEQEYDLDALVLDGTGAKQVLANADVVNLFSLPANHVILSASLECVTVGTVASSTLTLQLREGTTALSAALDMLTASGHAVGGNATYNMPLSIGTSAVAINLLAAVGATVTKNPKVKVKLLVVDMS